MPDWWNNIVSGFQNDPWGAIGNVGALGSYGLGAFSTITGALRAMEQARQADRVNKMLMETNRLNRLGHGANVAQYPTDLAAVGEARRLNLAQRERERAQSEEAYRLNLAQYERDEAERRQAERLNLSGYTESLAQARTEAARRNAGLDQLRALATAPIDVSEFLKPMSDAESTARKRAMSGDLATRGLPMDSSYVTNMIGESMAGTESQRYFEALRAALESRGQKERTLASTIPGTPTWGTYTPLQGRPFQPPGQSQPYTPLMSPGFPRMEPPAFPAPGAFPPAVDMLSPFAYLYLLRQDAARRREEPQKVTVRPIGSRDEEAYQTHRAWERNPNTWGLPTEGEDPKFPNLQYGWGWGGGV